ncbi:hypothetical protein Asp14428_57420 [Actinoplanes sp. NBRC 14428]|nr:hypothetical protein Asp14428_57420 [Actinoplanes sp. NBRC 14428]
MPPPADRPLVGGRPGAALVALALLAVAGAVAIALMPGPGSQRAQFVPMPPIPPVPDAAPRASATTSVTPSATRPARPPIESVADESEQVTAPRTRAPSTGTGGSTPKPSSKPPVAGFVAGTTIGLSPAGDPGSRVRHHDFRGRVDRIDARSPAGDRADSRFRVRRGAADARCVSFEAVNLPGFFLRHRNFELRLERFDGTPLFAADSTFCPASRGGGIYALRSVNYPDRYISRYQSSLYLAPIATGFTVRPPL